MEAHAAVAMEQAVALFDQQKYSEAFELFVEVYQQCQDLSERQGIFQILEDAYYLPNREEFRENYESNTALLKKYPYFWNKSFHTFEELSFQLFPISDDHYYCYDRTTDRFYGVYDAKTRYQMRYFFENLDRPLQVIDEDNLYNLAFLNDNVRRSEDFAGDNHIYLCYTSLEPLERLMLTCDLAPVLQQEKFVFLIEKKNWKRYPINFKKRYGFDYRKLSQSQLKIEEINRIYLNQFYAYSGTDFFEGVLNGSDHILVMNGWFFYESSKEVLDTVLDHIRHPDRILDVPMFLDTVQKHIMDVKLNGWNIMAQLLPGILGNRTTAAVHEIWKAIMIAAMMVSEKVEGKQYKSRVSPVIFLDPHGGPCSDYYELLRYFKYPAIEAMMREPVTRLMRYVSVFGFGSSVDSIASVVTSTYTHSERIPKWLTDRGFYAAKLEDMKLKPEQTLRVVCRTMNIPYTEKLLIGKIGMWGVLFTNEKGEQLIGFDQRSVKRDVSDMLAGDDLERLNLYYQPILRYFRYPCIESKRALDSRQAAELFSRPFKFEHIYAAQRNAYIDRMTSASSEEREAWSSYVNARYNVLPQEAREKLQTVMTETYLRGLYEELALPEVMFPEDDLQPSCSQSQRLKEMLYE